MTRLPSRRRCVTYKLRVGDNGRGLGVYLHVGIYPDGRVGEIQASVAKAGSVMRGWLDAWCDSVSSALQHGEPLESIIRTHKGRECEPRGRVQHFDGIAECSSIQDLVARILAAEYLTDEVAL